MSLGGERRAKDVRHFLIPLFMFGLRQSLGTVNIIKGGRRTGRSSGTLPEQNLGFLQTEEKEEGLCGTWSY